MDWLTIDSKMLASVAYDPDKRILHLRFRTGDVYRYSDFPSEDDQAFLNAESRRKYFSSNIPIAAAPERTSALRLHGRQRNRHGRRGRSGRNVKGAAIGNQRTASDRCQWLPDAHLGISFGQLSKFDAILFIDRPRLRPLIARRNKK